MKKENKNSPETNTLKLIHELEVHRIELEMHNEELERFNDLPDAEAVCTSENLWRKRR